MRIIASIICFAALVVSSLAQDVVVVDSTSKDLIFPTNRALLSTSEKASLTGGGASTDHYHASDRDRANHTGTQDWSTISGTPTTLSGYGITDGGGGSSTGLLAHPVVTKLHTFGDSITLGSTATDRTNRWVMKLASQMGLSLTNMGYGSATIPDIAYQAYPGFTFTNSSFSDPQVWSLGSINTNNAFAVLPGFNDLRDFGTNSLKLQAFKRGLGATLAYLGTPSSKLKTAQSASTTGSWSSSTWNGGSLGRYSSSAGATLTWTNVVGDVVYLGYQDSGTGTGGTFTVTVDGYSANAVSVVCNKGYGNRVYRNGSDASIPNTAGPYGTGSIDWMPSLLRLSGLGPAPHTIVVTVSSGTNRIDWLAAPDAGPPGDESGPHVYVGTPTRQATWNISGSDQAHAMYCEAIREVASRLRNDGLRIKVAPVGEGFDRLTYVGADTVHPNDTGHAYIANAFYSQTLRELSPFEIGGQFANQRSLYGSALEIRSAVSNEVVFGGPGWASQSAIKIAYANPALDRVAVLSGNNLSAYNNAGTAQNFGIGTTATDLISVGAQGYGVRYGGSAGPLDTFYAGTPEGNVTAPAGSTCRNTSTGVLYYKTGATSTGWVALGSGSGGGLGTNLIVNGTLYQPAIITNSSTVTIAANGNGHLEFAAVASGTPSKELRSWSANQFMPPSIGTNAALWAPRGNGIPAVSFAGSSPRTASVLLKVPQGHNLSGGLQLVLDACSTTAISTSNVVMQARYQLLSPAAATVDTASYGGAVLITNVFPGVVGVATNLTFNCPSWVFTAGQLYQIEFKRVTDSASDTNDASAVVVFNAQANTID